VLHAEDVGKKKDGTSKPSGDWNTPETETSQAGAVL
jgi:hypothetical protein